MAEPAQKKAKTAATKDTMGMVASEIATQAKTDSEKVVRGGVSKIGFDSHVDDLSSVDNKGLSDKTCEVSVHINKTLDIADRITTACLKLCSSMDAAVVAVNIAAVDRARAAVDRDAKTEEHLAEITSEDEEHPQGGGEGEDEERHLEWMDSQAEPDSD